MKERKRERQKEREERRRVDAGEELAGEEQNCGRIREMKEKQREKGVR